MCVCVFFSVSRLEGIRSSASPKFHGIDGLLVTMALDRARLFHFRTGLRVSFGSGQAKSYERASIICHSVRTHKIESNILIHPPSPAHGVSNNWQRGTRVKIFIFYIRFLQDPHAKTRLPHPKLSHPIRTRRLDRFTPCTEPPTKSCGNPPIRRCPFGVCTTPPLLDQRFLSCLAPVSRSVG